jgi:hypothetical protein
MIQPPNVRANRFEKYATLVIVVAGVSLCAAELFIALLAMTK